MADKKQFQDKLRAAAGKMQADGVAPDQIQAFIDKKKNDYRAKYGTGEGKPEGEPQTDASVTPEEPLTSEDGPSRSDQELQELQHKAAILSIAGTTGIPPFAVDKIAALTSGTLGFLSNVAKTPGQLTYAAIEAGLSLFDPESVDTKEEKLALKAAMEAIPGLTGAAPVVSRVLDKGAELFQKATRLHDKGITEQLASGEVLNAVDQTLQQVMFSAPSVAAAFTGSGGLAIIGASSFGGKFEEEFEKDPMQSSAKLVAVSAASAGIEIVSESFTAGIAGRAKALLGKSGREAAEKYVQSTFKHIAKEANIEGASESLATIANKYLDSVAYGREVDVKQLFKESLDAYIVGAATGGGIASAGAAGAPNGGAKDLVDAKTKTANHVEADKATASEINALEAQKETVPEGQRSLIDDVIETKKDEINERADEHSDVVTEMELSDHPNFVGFVEDQVAIENTDAIINNPETAPETREILIKENDARKEKQQEVYEKTKAKTVNTANSINTLNLWTQTDTTGYNEEQLTQKAVEVQQTKTKLENKLENESAPETVVSKSTQKAIEKGDVVLEDGKYTVKDETVPPIEEAEVLDVLKEETNKGQEVRVERTEGVPKIIAKDKKTGKDIEVVRRPSSYGRIFTNWAKAISTTTGYTITPEAIASVQAADASVQPSTPVADDAVVPGLGGALANFNQMQKILKAANALRGTTNQAISDQHRALSAGIQPLKAVNRLNDEVAKIDRKIDAEQRVKPTINAEGTETGGPDPAKINDLEAERESTLTELEEAIQAVPDDFVIPEFQSSPEARLREDTKARDQKKITGIQNKLKALKANKKNAKEIARLKRQLKAMNEAGVQPDGFSNAQVQRYIRDLKRGGKTSNLTDGDVELFNKQAHSDKKVNDMAVKMARYTFSVSKSFNNGVATSDMIQEANIAALKAIDAFTGDTAKDLKNAIANQIKTDLATYRRATKITPLPVDVQTLSNKIRKVEEGALTRGVLAGGLQAKLERVPTNQEIADAINEKDGGNITAEQVAEVKSANFVIQSLNDPTTIPTEDGDIDLFETVQDISRAANSNKSLTGALLNQSQINAIDGLLAKGVSAKDAIQSALTGRNLSEFADKFDAIIADPLKAESLIDAVESPSASPTYQKAKRNIAKILEVEAMERYQSGFKDKGYIEGGGVFTNLGRTTPSRLLHTTPISKPLPFKIGTRTQGETGDIAPGTVPYGGPEFSLVGNTESESARIKDLPLEAEDGATFNLDGTVYEGGGLVVPIASKNIKASELSAEAIAKFQKDYSDYLGPASRVGIYKFPGQDLVSIDLNVIAPVEAREAALQIGKSLGQESLFDLDSFENIKTGETGANPKTISASEAKSIANSFNEFQIVPAGTTRDFAKSFPPLVEVDTHKMFKRAGLVREVDQVLNKHKKDLDNGGWIGWTTGIYGQGIVPAHKFNAAANSKIEFKVAKMREYLAGKGYSLIRDSRNPGFHSIVKAGSNTELQLQSLSGTTPSAQYIQDVTSVLQEAYPNINIAATNASFAKATENLNVDPNTIKGAYIIADGTVVLNPNKMTHDTPIHEFAHIWARDLAIGNRKLFNKGKELLKGSDYLKSVYNIPLYKNYLDTGQVDRFWEEVMANAIGKHGAQIFQAKNKQSQWKQFMNSFSNWIKNKLNISSANDYADLTLNDFLDYGVAGTFTGQGKFALAANAFSIADQGARADKLKVISEILNDPNVYKSPSPYKKTRVDADTQALLRRTKLDLGTKESQLTDAQLEDLTNKIKEAITEGRKNTLEANKKAKEKRQDVTAQAADLIQGIAGVNPDTLNPNDVEALAQENVSFLNRLRTRGIGGVVADALAPSSNADYHGLVGRLLYGKKGKDRGIAEKTIADNLIEPLKDANHRYLNNKADLTNKFTEAKKLALGPGADAILGKSSKIQVGKNTLTNSQVVMVYNYIKDPRLHKQLKKGGVDSAKMNEILDYLDGSPDLKTLGDRIPTIFREFKGQLNGTLARHGYKDVGEAVIGTDLDAETQGVLNRIYDGKIPETAPYTPFFGEGSAALELTEQAFQEGEGNFYSVMSGRLKQRTYGGSVDFQGKNLNSMFDSYINGPVRTEAYLDFAKQNSAFFTSNNLKAARASLGDSWGKSMEDSLRRIITGTNNRSANPEAVKSLDKWMNRTIGNIMFLNVRSSILQMVSVGNFAIDSPVAYAKSAADVKATKEAFNMIWNSPFMQNRKAGKTDVVVDELFKQKGDNAITRGIDYMLEKGYWTTKVADGMAIAFGGAPWLANRIKELNGDTEQAMKDFIAKADELQQSTSPDRLGRDQTSPVGRYLLAFTNATQQFNRSMSNSLRDIQAGKDVSKNWGKISYIMGTQIAGFAFMQRAMQTALSNDDEEDKEKWGDYFTGIFDTLASSAGIMGSVFAAAGAAITKASRGYEDGEFARGTEQKILQEFMNISPAIATKYRNIKNSFVDPYPKSDGFVDIDPSVTKGANAIQAATGVPTEKILRKLEGMNDLGAHDLTALEKALRVMGWGRYELGASSPKKEPTRRRRQRTLRERRREERSNRTRR